MSQGTGEKAGGDFVVNWAAGHNVFREAHGSKQFNGESCKALLNNIQSLTAALPAELKCYGQALEAFNEVRISTFGDELNGDYHLLIKKFEIAFKKIGRKAGIFPKAHIIIDHLAEFCDRHGALGPFCEQTFESVHFSFSEHMEKSKYTRNMGNSNYATQLKKGILDFNALRVK